MAEHLLPPNATKFEKAVAATFARIQTISVPIAAVHNPATCPEPLLPWLAFHRGVDIWNASWPAPVRRAAIAASYDVKRAKGTRHGVVSALSAQGFVNIRYDSWFEYAGSPYRFRIAVDIAGLEPWLEGDDALLIATVLRTKAVRSRLEGLTAARVMPAGPVYVTSCVFIDETIEFDFDYDDLTEFPPPSMLMTSGISIVDTIELGPQP